MKKYIDVLTENIDDRKNVKIKMNASAGIIMRVNEDDTKQVLLIQRAADDHWPNHWEFPRGKCDHGKSENLISCSKREIKEETGLSVRVLTLIDTFQYLADKGTRLTTCYNYLCKMEPEGQEIKLSKEHQDYKWISEVGQAEMLVLPDQKRTIEKALNDDRPISTYPDNEIAQNNQIDEGYKANPFVDEYLENIQTKAGRKRDL